MTVSDLRRLEALDTENRRLKQIVAEQALDNRTLWDEWAYSRGVKLNFIRPGKPVENAFARSFIGRFRDECLNENRFFSLKHARDIIGDRRMDYNEDRPHGSPRGLSPDEYVGYTGKTLIAVGL